MIKVLVDRELLEQTVKHLEWDGDGSQTVMQYAQQGDRLAEELAEAIAQPAEAEGVRDYLAEFAEVEIEARTAIEELLAALSAVTAERDRLQSQLAETQANDRTAMGYLHDVRQLVGGSDFPEMVRNVARMVDALPGCVELIEALSPIEGDVLRKARAAMAAKEA
jgi:hypothetical protein